MTRIIDKSTKLCHTEFVLDKATIKRLVWLSELWDLSMSATVMKLAEDYNMTLSERLNAGWIIEHTSCACGGNGHG